MKKQLFQIFCNLCFAEWKKVKIYFTYDNIMEMTVEGVYIHNFPSILSIHLFSIIVTFDIVFFLGMWCYLHLFLSINGRRIELVEIYHKNYWGDIYIDMIFSLTHNYAVTIWRWSTLCGVTKKIYIIADIILSFQYMIYTEDKDFFHVYTFLIK